MLRTRGAAQLEPGRRHAAKDNGQDTDSAEVGGVRVMVFRADGSRPGWFLTRL